MASQRGMARTAALLAVVVVLAASAEAATPVTSVFDWLAANGHSRLVGFMDTLGINRKTTPPGAVSGTLLVPTNKAWDEFLKAMDLSEAELKARKPLLDILIAYHFIPGAAVTGASEIKVNPTIAATGDVNYILKFFKNGDKVTVQDVQGNTANALAPPTKVNKLALIPIDKVLLSGGVFTSNAAALKYYPQWSESFAFSEKTDLTEHTMNDYTMFVPVNSAWTSDVKKSVAALPLKQQRDILLYHFVKPAMHTPSQLKDAKYETIFAGHFLGVKKTFTDATDPMTGKTVKMPIVKVYPEVGSAAKIILYNIYVRRSILNGITKILTPKLPASGRHLLSSLANTNARRLLQRGDSGQYQQYANTIAESNTAAAINAAASGNIPVGYATKYGSVQASLANPVNGCINCLGWD